LSDLFNGFNFELIGITFSTHNSPHFYLLLYSYEMSMKVGPYQAKADPDFMTDRKNIIEDTERFDPD
ncbi:hypothetical protein V6259_17475, partial [Marinomonas sp. TI.3.20]|uniref:hypothetical protein n=1 Tax=Marinomonas sp. TI.3.20 TaxID=3121296 RepID=UPI00311F69F8